jgi:hypothetical protein
VEWRLRERRKENEMARIIVMPDPVERDDPLSEGSGTVLLEERVYPLHLDDRHAARQLIERLAWAVDDAEGRRPGG